VNKDYERIRLFKLRRETEGQTQTAQHGTNALPCVWEAARGEDKRNRNGGHIESDGLVDETRESDGISRAFRQQRLKARTLAKLDR
jgi:hypothetical protein